MKWRTFEAFKLLNEDDRWIKIEDETLQKCQKVILGIVEDVIRVCEKEGIWYALGGGTALGAVRHRGFIPWDDDADLNILGKDFERLGEAIVKEYGSKYVFLNYKVSDYGLAMGKIMLTDGIYRDRASADSKNCGFFVDLFPIENVPDNKLLRKLHGTLCMGVGLCLSCRKFYHSRAFMNEVAKTNPQLKTVIRMKIVIGWLLSLISLSGWATIADKIYGLCKNENTAYVTIPSSRKHYFEGMARREMLTVTAPAEFEGRMWAVAADRDGYLKRLYGPDYMTPPKGQPEHHMLMELQFPKELPAEEKK